MAKYLGTRLSNCPECGAELDDMGKDKFGIHEKECYNCDLLFVRKGKNQWKMTTRWADPIY